MNKSILDIFSQNVSKYGQLPCLQYKNSNKWVSISWQEVDLLSSSYAKGLVSLGEKIGEKAGIFASTRVEWTLADLAILKAGLVSVPIYHSASRKDIEQIINESKIKTIFVEDASIYERLYEVRESLPTLKNIIFLTKKIVADNTHFQILSLDELKDSGSSAVVDLSKRKFDIASVIYTSGTTGTQKGVVISHRNIVAEIEGLHESFKLSPDDILLSFLPLAHVLARAIQFYHLGIGCRAAYAESIKELPKNFMEVKPHVVVSVPRALEKIYEKVQETIRSAPWPKNKILEWGIKVGLEYGKKKRHGEAIDRRLSVRYKIARKIVFSKLHSALGGRIKFIVSGGAPLSEDLSKFFYAADVMILEGYGLTETTAAITVNRLDDFHLGSVGKPVYGCQIKIADDGEILVKGGMVFQEYCNLPMDTSEVFTTDGWFKTGDIGHFTRDGFLRITGRKKDMIITAGGKNIAPKMIEGLLEDNRYISRAVIHGDKRKYLTALLTLNMDEIKRYAKDRGLNSVPDAELYRHVEIFNLIKDTIESANKELASFETIKKFAILPGDFTVENGELTPTMKVRRQAIEERYRGVLDRLYQ